ncbi:hypothetical protein P0092_00625 [Ruminiclostridium papyrosolvens DSM 2782]|nr:hypothetical protein [Ruminiclostridium papyrosolvens]WES34515.1 hypothetical protein P0092_00625 [Ruminiclostridium papyrosolvens DSM 2782]
MENCDLLLTPVADKLRQLINRDITSFHALPISGKKSISSSAIYDKYKDLFGDDYYRSEMTITGENFDTPVLPSRCIKQSEDLTAKAFGARKSFYVTMGTTTANRIVINTMADYGARVLVDRSCHISIHFSVRDRKCELTYIPYKHLCKASGRSYFNFYKVVSQYKQALKDGRPYKLVILNGYSYEGVFYDLKPLIRECIKANDDVSFLIDEAWFAYGYFHKGYKKYTAMQIAADLQAEMPDRKICIVSTQSAHKSLSALRQGSYIHTFADKAFVRKLLENKFSVHTTSPSYPIIASLELARVQAVKEGSRMIEDSLLISKFFCEQVKENKRLSLYAINNKDFIGKGDGGRVFVDPLKISINLSKLKIRPKDFIRYAFDKFGIYINRYCNKSILINIHIGIKKQDILTLLDAMEEFQQETQEKMLNPRKNSISAENEIDYRAEVGAISECFVIPYPPGVPLLFKGDIINRKEAEKIKILKQNGVDLIVVK